MVVLAGDSSNCVERLESICQNVVPNVETMVVEADTRCLDLTGATALIVAGENVSAFSFGLARRAAVDGTPTAVLAESLLQEGIGDLFRAGVRWVGHGCNEAAVLWTLNKLGLLGADTPPVEIDWAPVGLKPENPAPFASIITGDPAVRAVLSHAELVARTRQTVLITGETGTGKDLLAESIHRAGGCTGRFVAENVSGLDDTLFSDVLFGHHRGSYTGADTSREGLVARAERGTLFLDEIGDLSPANQTKLLRLLENREYYPIGSDQPVSTNTRFVVATHRNLAERVRAGTFRRDLYYRLKVHELMLPPLYQRTTDIEPLARHFVTRVARDHGLPEPVLGRTFLDCLHRYSFPGNVRELLSIISRAVVMAQGRDLTARDFAPASQPLRPMLGNDVAVRIAAEPVGRLTLTFPTKLPSLIHAVELLVDEALKRTGGNQSEAARLLGISPSAVNKRLRSRCRS